MKRLLAYAIAILAYVTAITPSTAQAQQPLPKGPVVPKAAVAIVVRYDMALTELMKSYQTSKTVANTELSKKDKDRAAKVKGVLDDYLAVLDTASTAAKEKGDLDTVLLLKAERESLLKPGQPVTPKLPAKISEARTVRDAALTKIKTVDEANMKMEYEAEVAKAEASYEMNAKIAHKKMIDELNDLVVLETKADRIDSAVAVREYAKSIQEYQTRFDGRPEDKLFELATGVKMTFCWIPEGKAILGSPDSEKERSNLEKIREFSTQGYWLGKFPVTQGEYRALMGKNPSMFIPTHPQIRKLGIRDTSRFPLETVSWSECQAFLHKLNERGSAMKVFGKAGKFMLPHEDQWEYAYRGGKGNKQAFYWGDILNGDKANCNGEKPYGIDKKGTNLQRTTEVGIYAKIAPHPWGLCDMSGNVFQWCDNWFDSTMTHRAIRGGSWRSDAISCRAAQPDYGLIFGSPNIGIRVCFIPE